MFYDWSFKHLFASFSPSSSPFLVPNFQNVVYMARTREVLTLNGDRGEERGRERGGGGGLECAYHGVVAPHSVKVQQT